MSRVRPTLDRGFGHEGHGEGGPRRELDRISLVGQTFDRSPKVLLGPRPGIETDTHTHISFPSIKSPSTPPPTPALDGGRVHLFASPRLIVSSYLRSSGRGSLISYLTPGSFPFLKGFQSGTIHSL